MHAHIPMCAHTAAHTDAQAHAQPRHVRRATQWRRTTPLTPAIRSASDVDDTGVYGVDVVVTVALACTPDSDGSSGTRRSPRSWDTDAADDDTAVTTVAATVLFVTRMLYDTYVLEAPPVDRRRMLDGALVVAAATTMVNAVAATWRESISDCRVLPMVVRTVLVMSRGDTPFRMKYELTDVEKPFTTFGSARTSTTR